jgi:hypothetical protein
MPRCTSARFVVFVFFVVSARAHIGIISFFLFSIFTCNIIFSLYVIISPDKYFIYSLSDIFPVCLLYKSQIC